MTVTSGRIIVVLGYSTAHDRGLHPICRRRLDRAGELATNDDVVVLSGWARRPGTRSEAELMAQAWSGPAKQVRVDPDARSTIDNAVNVLDDVAQDSPAQLVVVTSTWHARRASVIFRWVMRHAPVEVMLATAKTEGGLVARLREVPCWILLPIQLSRTSDSGGTTAEID